MTELELNSLFAKAKTEPASVEVEKVTKWVKDAALLGASGIALFGILKVLTKYKIMMFTGLLTTTVVTAALLLPTNEVQPKEQKQPTKMLPAMMIPKVEKEEMIPEEAIVEPTKKETIELAKQKIELNDLPELNNVNPVVYIPKSASPALIGEEVGSFDRIIISSEVNLVLVQDGTEQIEINDFDKSLKRVDFVNDNGKLILNSNCSDDKESKKIYKEHGAPEVVVHFKEISQLIVSGITSVRSEELLSFEKMKVVSSGICNLDLQVKSEAFEIVNSGKGNSNINILSTTFKIVISGKADINVKGSVDELHYITSGKGILEAKELTAKNVNIAISGMSDVVVFCTEDLKVHHAGSGRIEYYGNPKNTTILSNKGDVLKMD